jgi:hypothetical protein
VRRLARRNLDPWRRFLPCGHDVPLVEMTKEETASKEKSYERL